MRKTRLVILPGARCLHQLGFLLLFLACPTIAFKGQENRDVQPYCRLLTLKQDWLPNTSESIACDENGKEPAPGIGKLDYGNFCSNNNTEKTSGISNCKYTRVSTNSNRSVIKLNSGLLQKYNPKLTNSLSMRKAISLSESTPTQLNSERSMRRSEGRGDSNRKMAIRRSEIISSRLSRTNVGDAKALERRNIAFREGTSEIFRRNPLGKLQVRRSENMRESSRADFRNNLDSRFTLPERRSSSDRVGNVDRVNSLHTTLQKFNMHSGSQFDTDIRTRRMQRDYSSQRTYNYGTRSPNEFSRLSSRTREFNSPSRMSREVDDTRITRSEEKRTSQHNRINKNDSENVRVISERRDSETQRDIRKINSANIRFINNRQESQQRIDRRASLPNIRSLDERKDSRYQRTNKRYDSENIRYFNENQDSQNRRTNNIRDISSNQNRMEVRENRNSPSRRNNDRNVISNFRSVSERRIYQQMSNNRDDSAHRSVTERRNSQDQRATIRSTIESRNTPGRRETFRSDNAQSRLISDRRDHLPDIRVNRNIRSINERRNSQDQLDTRRTEFLNVRSNTERQDSRRESSDKMINLANSRILIKRLNPERRNARVNSRNVGSNSERQYSQRENHRVESGSATLDQRRTSQEGRAYDRTNTANDRLIRARKTEGRFLESFQRNFLAQDDTRISTQQLSRANSLQRNANHPNTRRSILSREKRSLVDSNNLVTRDNPVIRTLHRNIRNTEENKISNPDTLIQNVQRNFGDRRVLARGLNFKQTMQRISGDGRVSVKPSLIRTQDFSSENSRFLPDDKSLILSQRRNSEARSALVRDNSLKRSMRRIQGSRTSKTRETPVTLSVRSNSENERLLTRENFSVRSLQNAFESGRILERRAPVLQEMRRNYEDRRISATEKLSRSMRSSTERLLEKDYTSTISRNNRGTRSLSQEMQGISGKKQILNRNIERRFSEDRRNLVREYSSKRSFYRNYRNIEVTRVRSMSLRRSSEEIRILVRDTSFKRTSQPDVRRIFVGEMALRANTEARAFTILTNEKRNALMTLNRQNTIPVYYSMDRQVRENNIEVRMEKRDEKNIRINMDNGLERRSLSKLQGDSRMSSRNTETRKKDISLVRKQLAKRTNFDAESLGDYKYVAKPFEKHSRNRRNSRQLLTTNKNQRSEIRDFREETSDSRRYNRMIRQQDKYEKRELVRNSQMRLSTMVRSGERNNRLTRQAFRKTNMNEREVPRIISGRVAHSSEKYLLRPAQNNVSAKMAYGIQGSFMDNSKSVSLKGETIGLINLESVFNHICETVKQLGESMFSKLQLTSSVNLMENYIDSMKAGEEVAEGVQDNIMRLWNNNRYSLNNYLPEGMAGGILCASLFLNVHKREVY